MITHIIWDWNGTLFHDIDAVLAATNAIFEPYGRAPLTLDEFRAGYRRPVWDAYADFLGHELTDGEWQHLDATYHDHYHELMTRCDLDETARPALDAWRTAGRTQSLLSMWWHSRLVPAASHHGLDGYFVRVDGLRGAAGGGKAEHMAAHIDALRLDPVEILVVGDSVDDIDAAHQVGARALGYTGGMTSQQALAATGAPVINSLADALEFTDGRRA